VETPAAVIGTRGGIGIFSQGPNGTQAINLNGKHSIQNGAGTTNTITGFMVNMEYAAKPAISDPARPGPP